ncbi:MAG: DUF998 domain-containing protein [Oscillochloris sp.]|nr:DUF998 domain-containing protein [Oscillochloris sp.]
MHFDTRRRIALMGIAGVFIILLAALITGLTYSGPEGEPYSLFNQNVSDLGRPSISALAEYFNGSLQLGGALLALFSLGLLVYVRRPILCLAAFTGIISASGIILVGMFPASVWQVHKFAFAIFFFSGMLMLMLATVSLIRRDHGRVRQLLAVPSGLGLLVYGLALFLPIVLYQHPLDAFVSGPPGENRPDIWLPSLLEWSVFFATAGWVLAVSFALMRHRRHT